MFDIGPAESIGLAAVALIVFGPDRLPELAADTGRLVRQARQLVNGAKHDLREQLGPQFADAHLSELNPHGLAGRMLSDPEDYTREPDTDVDGDPSRPPQPGRPLVAGDHPGLRRDTT